MQNSSNPDGKSNSEISGSGEICKPPTCEMRWSSVEGRLLKIDGKRLLRSQHALVGPPLILRLPPPAPPPPLTGDPPVAASRNIAWDRHVMRLCAAILIRNHSIEEER